MPYCWKPPLFKNDKNHFYAIRNSKTQFFLSHCVKLLWKCFLILILDQEIYLCFKNWPLIALKVYVIVLTYLIGIKSGFYLKMMKIIQLVRCYPCYDFLPKKEIKKHKFYFQIWIIMLRLVNLVRTDTPFLCWSKFI